MALDPISGAEDLARTIINKLWPDKTEAEKAQLAIAASVIQGQLAVDQAEASSGNWFAAGWRPFIGYTCGLALFYYYVGHPIGQWIVAAAHSTITVPELVLDDHLWELMLGMLGLGGMRTAEKLKGKA